MGRKRKQNARHIIKQVVAFTTSILIYTSMQGQSSVKVHPELVTGVNIPVGEEFSHVHFTGLNFGTTLFLTIKEKISIGPSLMVQYHRKNLSDGAKDELTGFAYGLMADYSIPVLKRKFKFYPQVGIFSQKMSDRLAARNGYRGDEIKILTAKDVAFVFGGALEFNHIRFSLNYKLFKSPVHFNQEIFTDLSKHNQHYTIFSKEEKSSMNFSSVMALFSYRF
jgi:hypothetical protein